MARFASIDMGTNTLRLLIAEVNTISTFRTIYSENRITRLGEGFSSQQRISPAATKRTLLALKHFQNIIKKEKVDEVFVVATRAVRSAENRDEFISIVRHKTDLSVTVLTGEEEARYTSIGVRLIFEDHKERDALMVLIDIGGGSTELVVTQGETPTVLLSLDLGAVTLTERFLFSDPPTLTEMRTLQDEVDGKLALIAPQFPKKCLFVGTAGTVTSLAAIELGMTQYNPDKINHYALKRGTIKDRLTQISRKPVSKWKDLPGLEKGREDILIAGTLMLLCIMDGFGYDEILVSDYGLREGLIMDQFKNKLNGTPQ